MRQNPIINRENMLTQGQENSKEDEEQDKKTGGNLKLSHNRDISRENLQKLKKSSKQFKEDKGTAAAVGGVMQSSQEQKKQKGDLLSKNSTNLHSIDKKSPSSQKHRKDNLAIQVENLQDNGDINYYVEQQPNSNNNKDQRNKDLNIPHSSRSKGTSHPTKQIQLFQSSSYSPLFQQITNFSQSPISLASKNDLDSSSQDELFSELRKSEVRLASLSLRFSLEGRQLLSSLPPSPFFIRDRESQKNAVIKSTKDSVVELGKLEHMKGFPSKNADKDQGRGNSSSNTPNDSSMNSEFINLYKSKEGMEITMAEDDDDEKVQGQNSNNLSTQPQSYESQIVLGQQYQLQDKALCFMKKKKQEFNDGSQQTSHLKQQRNLAENNNSNQIPSTSEKRNSTNGLSPVMGELQAMGPSLKDLLMFNHGAVTAGAGGGVGSAGCFVAPSGIDVNPSTRQLATTKNISLMFDVSFDKEEEDEEEELQQENGKSTKQLEYQKLESQTSQNSQQKQLISSPSCRNTLKNIPKEELFCSSSVPAGAVSHPALTTPTPNHRKQTNQPGHIQDSPFLCPKSSALCTPKQSTQSSKRNAILAQKQMQKIASTPASVPSKSHGFSHSPELRKSQNTKKMFLNGNTSSNSSISKFQSKSISGNNHLWNVKDLIPPNQRPTQKQAIPIVNLAPEEEEEEDNNSKTLLSQGFFDGQKDKKYENGLIYSKEQLLLSSDQSKNMIDQQFPIKPIKKMSTSDDQQGQRTAVAGYSCLKKNFAFSNKPIQNTQDNCPASQLQYQQLQRASNSPQKQRQGNNNFINLLHSSAYSKQLFPESTIPNVLPQNTARYEKLSGKKQQPYMLSQADQNNTAAAAQNKHNAGGNIPSSNNRKSREKQLHNAQTDKHFYLQHHHHHSNSNSRDQSLKETQPQSSSKDIAVNPPNSNITCAKRDSHIQLSSYAEKQSSWKKNANSPMSGNHYLPDSFGKFRKTPNKSNQQSNNDDEQQQQQQQQNLQSTSIQQHKESSLTSSNPISLINIIQSDYKSASSRGFSVVELKRSLSSKQQEGKKNTHLVKDQQLKKSMEKEIRGSLGVKPHGCQDNQELEKGKQQYHPVDKVTRYQQTDNNTNKLSAQSIHVIELSRCSSRTSSNACMMNSSSSPQRKLKNSLSVAVLKQPRQTMHGQWTQQAAHDESQQSSSTSQIPPAIYSAEMIIMLDDSYNRQSKESTSINEKKPKDQRITYESRKQAKSNRNEQDNNNIKNNTFDARYDDSQVDSASWRVSGQPTQCNSNRSSNLSNGYRLIQEQKLLSLNRQAQETASKSRLTENVVLLNNSINNYSSTTTKKSIKQQQCTSDSRYSHHSASNQRQSVDSPTALTALQILSRQLQKQSQESQKSKEYHLRGKNAENEHPTHLKLRDITSAQAELQASVDALSSSLRKNKKNTTNTSTDHLRESLSPLMFSLSGESQSGWIDSIKEDYYPLKDQSRNNDKSKKKDQQAHMPSQQNKQECIQSCLDSLSSKLNLLQLSSDGSYGKIRNHTKNSDYQDRKYQEQQGNHSWFSAKDNACSTPHRSCSYLNHGLVSSIISANSYPKRGSDGCAGGNTAGGSNIKKNNYADMQLRASITKVNNYTAGGQQQQYQNSTQEIMSNNEISKRDAIHHSVERQASILQSRSAKIRN